MVMEKRSIFLRIMSVIMALVMSLSFVLPVFAASSKSYNVTSSTRCTYAYITSGKGWMYSCGIKKTTVTVKNTGKGTVTVYKNIGNIGYAWEGSLAPGQTKTFVCPKGSAKNYSLRFQKDGRYNTTVQVSVNSGSVR